MLLSLFTVRAAQARTSRRSPRSTYDPDPSLVGLAMHAPERRHPQSNLGDTTLDSAPWHRSSLTSGLGSEYLDYQAAWDLQRAIHAEVSACTRPDTVLLLSTASVYTAGKRTEPQERPWTARR